MFFQKFIPFFICTVCIVKTFSGIFAEKNFYFHLFIFHFLFQIQNAVFDPSVIVFFWIIKVKYINSKSGIFMAKPSAAVKRAAGLVSHRHDHDHHHCHYSFMLSLIDHFLHIVKQSRNFL